MTSATLMLRGVQMNYASNVEEGSVYDFLDFRRMITPSVITPIWMIVSFLILVVGIGAAITTDDDVGRLRAILFALLTPILLRIYAELIIVLFRIYEELVSLNSKVEDIWIDAEKALSSTEDSTT